MNRRLRVCVLQVPKFDPAFMLGGAEVIAVQLVRALTPVTQTTVLHGYVGPPPTEPVRTVAGLTASVIAAFPLDEHVRERGHIQPDLNEPAQRALATADVLITVERTLDYPTAAARLACLGGVGYPHTLDVLQHRAWDRLVVPSDFVAEQVAAHSPDTLGVTVVENGIDLCRFMPGRLQRSEGDRVLLLVASRPGWDKGFRHAIDLTRALEQSGIPVVLACFEQPDGFGPDDFTARLRQEAAGVRLDVLPWQPYDLMPDVYRSANLTLCLGNTLEGFGLVAAESVACGTPVLAYPVGFLARMFPPGHGLYLVPSNGDLGDWLPIAKEALSLGQERCLDSGRPYAFRRYGLDRMTLQLIQLVYTMGERR